MNTIAIALLSALATFGSSKALSVGSQAPAFEVTDTAGQALSLDSLARQGPVVMVFFPAAKSPGCSKELRNLTAAAGQLQRHGATLVAIASDKREKMEAFKAELGASFAFVADEKGELMAAYGTKMPFLNRSSRRTIVIGKDKVVKEILRDSDAIELKGLQALLDDLSVGGGLSP